jgi:Golgi nucleoside diphosphatase
MKRKKILLLTLVPLFVFVLIFLWFFVYNKPHRNIEKAEPDFVMEAEEVIRLFEENDSSAQKKFLDKVVQFSGNVTSKESADTTVTIVFDLGGTYVITAQMLPKYKGDAEKLSSGSRVQVKGLYNGVIPGDADFGLPAAIVFNKCSFQK